MDFQPSAANGTSIHLRPEQISAAKRSFLGFISHW
jgi:hypothetical protein